STLFPYTTLFRSADEATAALVEMEVDREVLKRGTVRLAQLVDRIHDRHAERVEMGGEGGDQRLVRPGVGERARRLPSGRRALAEAGNEQHHQRHTVAARRVDECIDDAERRHR